MKCKGIDQLYTYQRIHCMSDVVWNCFRCFSYLRQVLDEALRCSILAPYAARFEDVESELGGHRIPAGVSARARTALV